MDFAKLTLLSLLLQFIVVRQSSSSQIVYKLNGHDSRGYQTKTYDYIIVGGGGAGCVVSRTLADFGFEVLLIERGDLPRDGSLALQGLKNVLLDNSQMQPVVTASGVRSGIGSVLGGGTAVNIGIWIEENWEYFDKLNILTSEANTPLNLTETEVNNALLWLRNNLGHAKRLSRLWGKTRDKDEMLKGYSKALRNSVETIFGPFRLDGNTSELKTGTSWTSWTIFSEDGGTRHSAGKLLKEAGPNLTVLLNSTVLSIETNQSVSENGTKQLTANCVIYRETLDGDKKIEGNIDELVEFKDRLENQEMRRSQLNIRLNRQRKRSSAAEILLLERLRVRKRVRSDPYPFRVCLTDRSSSIILAAGALKTPALLMQSGIGPREEIAKMKTIPTLLNVPEVGKNLQDRPAIGVSFFLKEAFSHLDSEVGLITAIKPADPADTSANFSHPFDQPCSPFEEIAGGTAQQGLVTASRLIFPPRRRNDLFSDIASALMGHCDSDTLNGTTSAGKKTLLEVGCSLLKPMNSCFASSVALWTFLSHVRSKGSIRFRETALGRQPEIIYDVKYLTDKDDLAQMRLNLRYLLSAIDQDSMRDFLVSVEDDKCPLRQYETEGHAAVSLLEMSAHSLGNSMYKKAPSTNTSMPFASLPQSIPAMDDDVKMDQFIQNYHTSMWHFIGSSQIGKVLDENLDVKGVKRLSVIDASAVPLMPRMNPMSTVLAMARMAAHRKGMLRNM